MPTTVASDLDDDPWLKTAHEATVVDRGRMARALGPDYEQWLVDVAGTGWDVETIRDAIYEHSNGRVYLPLARTTLLVTIARRTRVSTKETAQQARVLLSDLMGKTFGKYLSSFPVDVTPETVERALAERFGQCPVTLPELRLAMALERGANLDPDIKAKRPAAQPAVETGQPAAPKSSANAKAETVPKPKQKTEKKQTAPKGDAAPVETPAGTPPTVQIQPAPTQAWPVQLPTARNKRIHPKSVRGSLVWLVALERHLDTVLGKGCRAVVMACVNAEMKKGATVAEAFDATAKHLQAHGARADLTGPDVQMLCDTRRWWQEDRRKHTVRRPPASRPPVAVAA